MKLIERNKPAKPIRQNRGKFSGFYRFEKGFWHLHAYFKEKTTEHLDTVDRLDDIIVAAQNKTNRTIKKKYLTF